MPIAAHADGTASSSPATAEILRGLLNDAALDPAALQACELAGGEGAVLPSSFAVASAAQASLAAAALAAAELDHHRHPARPRRRVRIDRRHVVAETLAWSSIDGRVPNPWDPLSGLYPCGPDGREGWVRVHANFAHHRDGALRLLGLPAGATTTRDAVRDALTHWRAVDFEQAAADAGLAVAAARSFDTWDAHPQSKAIAASPLVAIDRIADAPALAWPTNTTGAAPLAGLRVLDLTRILAGPMAGRTLAACGADVMLVNAPHLPNIEAIADTSRGKLSAHVDLRGDDGREAVWRLIDGADVFLQGYRPGALEGLGFGAEAIAQRRPGIVVVSLSAYGESGPWAGRRGFDSLVQTATGFNLAEAEAFGSPAPKPLPMQILDCAAGFLLAFGADVALMRQRREGGSWRVRVTLAGVAHWLRSLGRRPDGIAMPTVDAASFVAPYVEESASGFGRLRAVRPAIEFDGVQAVYARASMPPGSHAPAWPS